jgi:hypothetical protein
MSGPEPAWARSDGPGDAGLRADLAPLVPLRGGRSPLQCGSLTVPTDTGEGTLTLTAEVRKPDRVARGDLR